MTDTFSVSMLHPRDDCLATKTHAWFSGTPQRIAWDKLSFAPGQEKGLMIGLLGSKDLLTNSSMGLMKRD